MATQNIKVRITSRGFVSVYVDGKLVPSDVCQAYPSNDKVIDFTIEQPIVNLAEIEWREPTPVS